MECIPKTYYRDWMSDPRDEVTTQFTFVFDKGKDNDLMTFNGRLGILGEDLSSMNSFAVESGSDITITIVNNTDDTVIVTAKAGEFKATAGKTQTYRSTATLTYRDYIYQLFTQIYIGGRSYTDGRELFNVTVATANGGLSNIDFGTVSYDTSDICSIFDRYYRNWFIVQPFDEDFRVSLQECYDMNKERINRFYAHVNNADFSLDAHTVMTVEYGERNLSGDGYDYPITGDTSTATPSSGTKSKEDAKTDTTKVVKDDNPVKTAEDYERLKTFNQFFIECFKPCFTLGELMTW